MGYLTYRSQNVERVTTLKIYSYLLYMRVCRVVFYSPPPPGCYFILELPFVKYKTEISTGIFLRFTKRKGRRKILRTVVYYVHIPSLLFAFLSFYFNKRQNAKSILSFVLAGKYSRAFISCIYFGLFLNSAAISEYLQLGVTYIM